MKKKYLLFAIVLLCAQETKAQFKNNDKYGVFNHLGMGLSIGSDGIGFDLASPVTDYFALRAGVSFWPKIAYKTNIDINDNSSLIENNVDIKAKLNIFDAKLLADIYPFKNGPFHLTVGTFLGKNNVVSATNTSMFIKDPTKYGKLGLLVGNHRITTDKNGYINADVKVNNLKPYIGVGFGRAVPKKHRINLTIDLGCQFWGSPRVAAMTKDDWGNESYHKFTSDELDEYDDEDLKDAIEFIEKLVVLPVINIRFSGRFF